MADVHILRRGGNPNILIPQLGEKVLSTEVCGCLEAMKAFKQPSRKAKVAMVAHTISYFGLCWAALRCNKRKKSLIKWFSPGWFPLIEKRTPGHCISLVNLSHQQTISLWFFRWINKPHNCSTVFSNITSTTMGILAFVLKGLVES